MSAADVTVEVTDHPVHVEVVHGYVYVDMQDASVEVITSGPPGPPGAGTPSGGTTGQVLAKASDVDHDVAWVDPSGGSGVEAPTPGGLPANVNLLPATAGTSLLYARADHKHYAQVAAPVALGAAINAGSSNFLSRADHVHPYPSAADVGADPAGTASNAVAAHEAAIDPHPGYLTSDEVVAGANITVDTTTTPGSVIITGGSGLPDATAAAAKDILALDDNKAPVWSPELTNLEATLGEVRQAIGDPSPLHINNTLSEWLGDLSDEVHRLSARPAFSLDGILHVDNMAGFARVFSSTPALEDGTEKWIEFELAVTPTTGGSVFTDVAQVASSGGLLVRAGGVQGPVVGANDGAISTKALAGYIGENRICRVVFDKTNPVRPVLKILETLDAIPTGASDLMLGSLYDVTAPVNTPAGKVLGTTAEGAWGPVGAGVGTDPLAPAGRAGEYPIVAVYADLPQTGNWVGRRIQAGSALYEWTGTMWGYVVKPGLLSASGDLLTRSASGLARLPVGVDGQVLTADSTAPNRIAWKSVPDGGGGGVTDHGALTGLSDPDHPISAVIGLQQSLDAKADATHNHDSSYLTFSGASATYAIKSHTHTIANVTGLQTALDSKAASTDLAAVADTVPTAIAAHEAAADPHPQYLTAAEAPQPATVSSAIATNTNTVGTSLNYARQDHKHQVLVGSPVALGPVASDGVLTTLARADHVHPFPTAANVGALTQAQADGLYAPKVVVAAARPGSPTVGTIWVPSG